MQIKTASPGLDFTRSIIRRVANRYRSAMIHREVISGKLDELTVFIREKTEADRQDGFYQLLRENNRIRHYIQLHISPDQSHAYIAFTAAHEMAHMLLSQSSDYANRFLSNREIPYCIQESMADRLARYIAGSMRFYDTGLDYIFRVVGNNYWQELSDLIAEGFGAPLEDAEYIDDFTLQTLTPPEKSASEASEEDFWKEYFLPEMVQTTVYRHVHNEFWYNSVLGGFYRIPEIYDDVMGKGSFDSLCDDLSLLQFSWKAGFPEEKQAAIQSVKERSEEALRQFAAIQKEKRQKAELQCEEILASLKKEI